MFFNKKKKLRQEQLKKVENITLPVLIRQILYDTMLMPAEDIAREMGLPPISDEVADMEELASQDRLEHFSRLIPFIDSHADIAARIAAAAYSLDEEDDALLNKDDRESLTRLFRLISLSSSISCISTLFNLGLIESKVAEDVK